MANHPAIDVVIDRIARDLIGGAADVAREVMDAMAKEAEESKANNLDELYADLDSASYAIMKVCPSFAPPINVLHMMMGTIENAIESGLTVAQAKDELAKKKDEFSQLIGYAFEKIAEIGAELIKDGDRVMMFSMTSSVWNVLRKAKASGKNFTVLVTEARPGNEGLWTVAEMVKSNIPVEVSIDACLAELVASSDIAFSGADAVGADGSVFNKSGTYLVALAAHEYNVPFYFVSDTFKFDTSTLLGLPYRNEKIKTSEILGDKKYPSGVKVTGDLFDVTPPHLVKAIITELGPINPSACVSVMWKMKLSKRISGLIPDWVYGRL
jgi:translation initiation factor 2B subunit (eIF-2B alpha/beta/delta family)